MAKCGYYGCRLQALHGQELCEEHDTPWSREDYEKYKAEVADGQSRYVAAVNCGLIDPDEARD